MIGMLRVGLIVVVLGAAPARALAAQDDGAVTALTGEVGVRPEPGSLLGRNAALRVRDLPLAEALTELGRKAEVSIAFSSSVLPEDAEVDCDCASTTVAEALDRLLLGTELGYVELDGQVVIVKRAPIDTWNALDAPAIRVALADPAPTRRRAGAGAATLPTPMPQPLPQEAPIEGVVVDSRTGQPIAGAQVALPATGRGALTNAAGRFLIPGVDAASVEIEVVMIGYRTDRRTVSVPATGLRIELVQTALDLEEIVVTGTAGNQARGAQPAVVSTIDAAEVVTLVPLSSVTQVLRGQVPGIAISQGSGTTGASSRINIRGAASLSLSNEPLVFIDGVRMESRQRELVDVGGQSLSALDDLNPADVVRIEVVKGPAAATLYGADASAGVIQIFTKRGSAGTHGLVQTATLEYGLVQPNFAPLANYAACPAGLTQPGSGHPLCEGLETGAIVSDNPLARQGAFDDGEVRSIQYSARGGGTDFGYYASFAADDEDGTTSNNTFERRTGRVNFNWVATDELAFEATMGFGRNRSTLPPGDQSSYGYLIGAGLGSPLTVRREEDGSLAGGWLLGNESVEAIASILSEVTAMRVTPSVTMRFTPVPWFTSRLTFGGDITRSDARQFYPRNTEGWYSGDQANGWIQSTQSNTDLLTLDWLGSIRSHFGAGDRFTSDLSFGSQYLTRELHVLSATGIGLTTNSSNLVSGAATNAAGDGYSEQKSLGLFLQEQIGWRDRLFVQVGARVDRNSAFGSDAGSFFLPKVGVSWIVSQEPFWEGLEGTISTLRLRSAWGTTGRSPQPGASLATYLSTPYVTDVGGLEPGLVPLNPGNPDLQPERGTEFEAGLDAGFFDDRIGLELTFFEKRTSDLLLQVPLPPSSGYTLGGASRPWRNLGEVLNRGVEFSLRGTPISRADLEWSLEVHGSTLHNELVSLGGVDPFVNSYRAFTPGRPLGAWFVNRIRSVDEEAGRVIVSDTAEYLGSQMPSFEGSLVSNVTLFGDVRLYARLDGKFGHRVYNLGQEYRDRFFRNSETAVKPAGQGGFSDLERLRRYGPYVTETSGSAVPFTEVKEDYIQPGDHVRFSELSVTLPVPARYLGGLGLEGASLTLAGSNLALWSDFEGFDPEILGTGPGTPGSTFYDQFYIAEVFTTPPTRRWVARVSLQF